MKVAWSKTKNAITAAYEKQATSKGLSANQVEVSVTGSPDFNQNDNATQSSVFKDFKFKVRAGEVKCLVLPEAFR